MSWWHNVLGNASVCAASLTRGGKRLNQLRRLSHARFREVNQQIFDKHSALSQTGAEIIEILGKLELDGLNVSPKTSGTDTIGGQTIVLTRATRGAEARFLNNCSNISEDDLGLTDGSSACNFGFEEVGTNSGEQEEPNTHNAGNSFLHENRLQRWLGLQKRALQKGENSIDSSEAAAMAMNMGQREVFLESDDFTHLLRDAALCPAFSTELFAPGGLFERIFIEAEDFVGLPHERRRRQYFRNQMLYKYYEKTSAFGLGLDAMHAWDASGIQDGDGCVYMQALLNHVYNEGETPENVENHVHGCFLEANDVRRYADFVLENEKYPYIVAWGKGDYFLLREGRAANEPDSGECAREERDCEGVQCRSPWFLGEVSAMVSKQHARVSVIQLLIQPLSHDPAQLTKVEFQSFEMTPIEFLPTVLRLETDAIHNICFAGNFDFYAEFIQNIVFGGAYRPMETLTDGEMQGDASETVHTDLSHSSIWATMNDQQRAAVAAASSPDPVTLIQGPPGTGKTTVAAGIVEAWIRQNKTEPILVATGTHTAKNLLVTRLQNSNIEVASRGEDNKTKERRQYTVYVETVYMAASPEGRNLPRVIIDESTQISEASALVALGQGCQKLVLIGDPKQLGPVTNLGSESKHVSPDLLPYANERRSFYERMVTAGGIPILLDVQYRMSPRLRAYPAMRFYADKLVDGPTQNELKGIPDIFCVNDNDVGGNGVSAVFIDTAELEDKYEELVPSGGRLSLRNRCETNVVVSVVGRLFDCGVSPKCITALTGYGAQRDALELALHPTNAKQNVNRRWQKRAARMLYGDAATTAPDPRHPNSHTVDGFQGSENDFIIFSVVRSNEEKSMGFAGDPRRVCVLLTRARRGLVVVGDSTLLQDDEEWGCWLRESAVYRMRASEFL